MGVEIQGPKIWFYLFDKIPITETVVNTWIVMAVLVALSIFLTRNLKIVPTSKRQVIAEWAVTSVNKLVHDNMGEKWKWFAPYIGTLLSLSAFSSLSSLIGMRPPTADVNTILAWALVTFVMIQGTKLKTNGFFGYLKSFTQPVAVMTPMNIISELATPVSMTFRHFGNIAAGVIITALEYAGLAVLSHVVLGFIPNAFIQSIPIFQLGIPAILSVYFDLFTSCMQAYIFCMLTMTFVSSAAE